MNHLKSIELSIIHDKLTELLNYFALKARVFQPGPLCHSFTYDMDQELEYIHVQKSGLVRIESTRHPHLLIDEPNFIFYINPVFHKLLPMDEQVTIVCVSF